MDVAVRLQEHRVDARAAGRALLQLRLESRGDHVRPGLLPLDAVSLPSATQEGPRLPERGQPMLCSTQLFGFSQARFWEQVCVVQ